MTFDLNALVAPDHTALVTVELQEGVVGDGSLIPELARAAEPILPRVARLARAARAVGAPVVHCTAASRGDALGANHNTRLLAAMVKRSGSVDGRLRGVTVHPAVGVEERDLVLSRLHGLSPMTSTSLDPILRNLGITTIVATGVSLNVAVLGFAFEAVNLGYQFVLPRDAVAGVDAAYVDALFDHTLSLLTTVTTTDDLLGIWEESE